MVQGGTKLIGVLEVEKMCLTMDSGATSLQSTGEGRYSTKKIFELRRTWHSRRTRQCDLRWII